MNEKPQPFRPADRSAARETSASEAFLAPQSSAVLGGLRIQALTRAQWAALFADDLVRMRRSGHALPARVMTSANGNVLSLHARSETFRRLVDTADGVDADGMSLVVASRWLDGPVIPERVATTDFVHDLAAAAAQARAALYLLGGTAEANLRARARLEREYPGLAVAGRDGYFESGEEEAVIDDIRRARPDLVLVGMGVPRELEVAHRLRAALPGVTWIKTCGGLFDFLSGRSRRAPAVLQRLGLEWAYRTWREPRRLLWRYLTTNAHTVYLLARQRVGAPARRALD